MPEKMNLNEAQELYISADKHPVRSALVPFIKLFFGGKKARMDNATKDQLAVLLKYYEPKLATVENFSDLGEYGSQEREKAHKNMTKLGYKQEGELSKQSGNVNIQDVQGNSLSRVLGMFGAAKDSNGNFIVEDQYDNDVYRIPKEYVKQNKNLFKGVQLKTSNDDPNHYIIYENYFDTLRDRGVLPQVGSRRWTAFKTGIQGLWNEFTGTPMFSGKTRTLRLKKLGENAVVQLGRSQDFDFTMSKHQVDRRVARLQRKNNNTHQ